jgi:hypothetical protein
MGSLLHRLVVRGICFGLFLQLGCGAPPTEPPGEEAPRPPRHTPPELPALAVTSSPRLTLAFAANQLALFDADSGEVLSEAPTLGLDGPRDVALGAAEDRVFVVESDLDDGSSELAEYALSAGSLGERAAWGPVDGELRVLPTAFGTLLFERSYGERVRLSGGAPGAVDQRALPSPTSLTTEPSADGLVLRLLTRTAGSGPTQLVRLRVDGSGLGEPEVHELADVSPSARVAGPWLADIQGEQVVLRRLEGAELGPARSLELNASRLEHFVELGDDRFALLLSGPSAVALLTLERGAAPRVEALPLRGRVAVADVFFSRDLVALAPDLLLVATDAGVTVLGVAANELRVERELPALAGPFAALRR